MNELEKHLEIITNRSNLQEVGVVWPNTLEWDVALLSPQVQSAHLADL